MTASITVTPAYGRDYRSGDAAIADWIAGKDFILNDPASPWDGKPISRRDAQHVAVRIRFGKARRVVLVAAEASAS